MNKFIILPVLMLICTACCTKKHCDAEHYPVIEVKFQNLPQNVSGKITVYTLKYNSLQDSMVREFYNTPVAFTLYPYREPENPSTFRIKWENKEESVSNIHSNFVEEKVKCNTCFPFGDGSGKVLTSKNFSYQNKNQTYHLGDTLYLSW